MRQKNGEWTKYNDQKVAIFAENLEKIFQPHEGQKQEQKELEENIPQKKRRSDQSYISKISANI